MCGIAGFIDLTGRPPAGPAALDAMLGALKHRGPDGDGVYAHGALVMGMRRLSILDAEGSQQPLHSEDGQLVLIGNGEIFNYIELRAQLLERGHRFATDGDLEVVLHLYQEHGVRFVEHINGQFALALYDRRSGELMLFRDHFGITPLFYSIAGGTLIFGSEIKAILRHPAAPRKVDLAGLDSIICFPGLVSPHTMFDGVQALRPGHYVRVAGGQAAQHEYWDLDYPPQHTDYGTLDENEQAAAFRRLFDQAVALRMRSDRPIGVYLSGGLDSSFVAASMRQQRPGGALPAFSIVFPDQRSIDERRFQRMMALEAGLDHIEVPFHEAQIGQHLRDMVWHAECPVKESYNTCSMALAAAARQAGVAVVLGGEGADELLAGYPGYRFDSLRDPSRPEALTADEAAARQRLWGCASVRYERQYHQFGVWRRQFYSDAVLADFGRVDRLAQPPLRTDRLHGRHPVHQRSYIDSKLRMADHLLGDHGDRMAMWQSVEGRYPFLDRHLVDFVRGVAPERKVRGLDEKILLKHAAQGRVPQAIVRREKFGFRSQGSHALLRLRLPWVEDLLDPARLRRQGYLNPDTIAALAAAARQPGTQANPHAEDDLLLVAITFGLLLELFDLPDL
ncbi:asparagine synthase (glutamine-hydrolyzing) [Rugamonas sp. FT82W]|uniref:asparagine synthase (glutamine-hydrolyzing) n=1 Tax=Duganella vulcania TaxID=2692166 RepID=A0A845GEU1_9BURK|nr:asparagine synthase (glutamine-hydrolyzing) [Duganella vulcania]MYM91736.1 asparagine synthase (glutamine-hydrolyzing) [Duganella vulcania]